MKPNLSIIIPCYNAAKIIDSLALNLAKLKPQPQLIFVDDGSTDGTAKAIQAHFPEAIYHYQDNAGVASARNTGASFATGSYLLFLDCDDSLTPETLWPRVQHAIENELDVQVSNWRMEIRTEDSRELEPIRSMALPDNLVAALIHGNWWGPPHAYLIRRECYTSIDGSDSNLVNAQDFDVWIRLAIRKTKWGHSQLFGGHYVRDLDRSSLARGPRRQYWQDTETVLCKAVDLLGTDETLEAEVKAALAIRLHHIARNVYRFDRDWYDRLIQRIHTVQPHFQPEGSRLYRLVAKCLGLSAAEHLAQSKHQLFNRKETA